LQDVRGQRRPRLALALVAMVLVSIVVPAFPGTAVAATGQEPALSSERRQSDGDPEQQLADRYAPIVYLRQVNNDICNTTNEGFDPIAVDAVLGRPTIPLRMSESGRPAGPLETVAEEPTAADLYGRDANHFLDMPGTPLRPRCDYRRDYAAMVAAGEVEYVAYAHIYIEPDTDELALQYWMYYYFNDWNNDHESDWEMIMFFFDTTSVEEALTMEPTRLIYAQHGGGERAEWGDDKLRLEDGHPVVYSARGAHASFYEQGTFFGLAEQGTGFGCETTKGPHRRHELTAVVVPHEPTGQDDPFAWLAFDGRWGELRGSEWNGPTGPNDKTSWTEPVSWDARQRDSSIKVPEFEGFGQGPVDLFCGIVSAGSRALVAFTTAPMIGLGTVVGVFVVVGWLYSGARGILRDAIRYYRRNLKTFGLIGAALIPGGYIIAALQTLLFMVPPIEPLVHMLERFPGVRIFLILLLGSTNAALASLLIAPVVIWTMREFREGRRPNLAESFREGFPHVVPVLLARLKVIGAIIRDLVTIIRIPRAIRRAIRTFFIGQAVIYQQKPRDAAISESAELVGMAVRRTVITQLVLSVVVLLTGPLLAIFLLLMIPSRPLGLINFVSSLFFALLYPLASIGMTLLYGELRSSVPKSRAGDAHD
jgi:hypothetical protein